MSKVIVGRESVGDQSGRLTRPYARRALLATLIGLLLYGVLYAYVEYLTYEHGNQNSFFQIATHGQADTTLILGASHALPFEYHDMNDRMEEAVGGPVLNVAITGGGVVPNQLLLDYYLAEHGADDLRTVIYFLDSFALYSREWNEDRLTDDRLWERAPLDADLALTLWEATYSVGLNPAVVTKYLSGFTKVNDPVTWYAKDVWDSEADFEKTYTASDFQDRQRIEYLYPEPVDSETFERYLELFGSLMETLKANDIPVVVVKPPLREEFSSRIPGESTFDERVSGLLEWHDIPFHDFSRVDFDASYYFDPDHLNRQGAAHFLDNYLLPVLIAQRQQVGSRGNQ